MRNEHGGKCYRCGLWVAPGTGYFERIRFKDRKPGDPKWRVQHCYRTHNGGMTCEMAKDALILADNQAERSAASAPAQPKSHVDPEYDWASPADMGAK